MANDKYTIEKVTAVKAWTSQLFSIKTTRPTSLRFTAGQFGRIGLARDNRDSVFRAYSFVSSPYDEELEFFSVVVPNGEFTSQLQFVKVGDEILVEKIPFGFLTLDRFQAPPPAELWLLATGTGVAPFLSILEDFTTWEKYSVIILAYSVRYEQDLAYLDRIEALAEAHRVDAPRLIFLPIVTRDPNFYLHERIPELIQNGKLESSAGYELSPRDSHVLICGNPKMVEETRKILIDDKHLTMNRRGEGNIAVENYW